MIKVLDDAFDVKLKTQKELIELTSKEEVDSHMQENKGKSYKLVKI